MIKWSLRASLICLVAIVHIFLGKTLAARCFTYEDLDVRERDIPFRSDCAFLVDRLRSTRQARKRMTFSRVDIPGPHQKVPQHFQWQSCVVSVDLEPGVDSEISSLLSIGGTIEIIYMRCVAYGSSPTSPNPQKNWLVGYGGHANCGNNQNLKVSIFGPRRSSTASLGLPLGLSNETEGFNVTVNA